MGTKYVKKETVTITKVQEVHVFSENNSKNIAEKLGSVDLWSTFLQQFVGYLYKAEHVTCSYST